MSILLPKNNKMKLLLVAAVLFVSQGLQAQTEGQEPEQTVAPATTTPDVNPAPVIGSSTPWESSSNATATPDNPQAVDANGDNNIVTGGNSNGNSRNAARRPGSGTLQAREPGDNPDVPFSKSLNALFLMAGIGFAFWAGKKKWMKGSLAAGK
jgi:hypothetical protein